MRLQPVLAYKIFVTVLLLPFLKEQHRVVFVYDGQHDTLQFIQFQSSLLIFFMLSHHRLPGGLLGSNTEMRYI